MGKAKRGSADDALTPQQVRFVEEYLFDLNSTKAAARAGYSRKSAGKIGWELLQKTRIQRAVSLAKKERAERLKISTDDVLRALWKLATADIWPVVDAFENGKPIPEIRGVRSLQYVWREGRYKFLNIQAFDKSKALELLARHFGLLDRPEDGSQNGGKCVICAFRKIKEK